MRSSQNTVEYFHLKFGLTINRRPTLVDDDELKLRYELINEEAQEFEDAAIARDMVEMADALADLAYVVFGAAVTLGINLQPIFQEVHRSNMTKIWPDGTVHKDDVGKVIKPPSYSPAAVEEELYLQGWRR